MDTYVVDNKIRSGVGVAVGLSVVWLIAATFRPTATFHLAPILIAGAAPVLAQGTALSRRGIVAAAVIGATVAVAAGVLLVAFDLMRGPTLLPYGGAFAEAITFTVVGAAAGVLIGINASAAAA